MNSIKRFTKRVKHTILSLSLDVRGADQSGAGPAAILTVAAGVGAAGVYAQHQFGETKATLDTASSGTTALGTKLTQISGGTAAATPPAVDPSAAQ